MKKIFYLLLLITGFSNAQIVNIPDANFKAKLLSSLPSNTVAGNLSLTFFKIDSNSDGQIQVSEALQVGYIDVSNSSINNLTGIEAFTGLKTLICNNNQISNLGLSVFSNLQVLRCHNNQISNLDVSGLSNLQQLKCNNNLLTSLIAVNLMNIFILDCSYNQISSLNTTGLINLSTLNCQGNQLSNLSLTGLSNLRFIYCGGNQLPGLDLTGLPILQELYCNLNIISSLDVSSNINLKILDISNNLFSSINLNLLSNLERLVCNNNSIQNLDLTGLNNLQFLNCRNNLLQTLNVNGLNNLSQIYCYNNLLTSLFIKNGVNENILSFYGNPNLQFICADLTQINSVQSQLNSLGLTSTVSNTYCSFTPGGNYNTITGNIKFDANNNGCDASDLPHPNIRIDINDGTNQGATFTNNSGNYNFYTQAGSFVLTPNIENPTWFNFSPATATIPFANNNNNTTTQNFCISANGIHPDLEIVIAPIAPARPGFDAVYQIVYKNKGNQTLSQLYGVNFFFNQNLMDFISATTAPATIGSGSLSWSYANLLPFESRSIYVTLNINTPTDVNYPVNIGDILQFTTSILPIAGDETTSDNTFLFNQTVVGSYDPNDITCIEGTSVSPSLIGEYLHYVINFENTGTAAAENVVVKATIDTTKFNLNSLQLLNTSHPSYVKITGNIVEFIFENIALDTGGHGNILLKIRSNGTLQSGDNVSNRGDIFFDYNAPIDTGIANTVFQSLNNSAFEKDNSVVIFPNPTKSIINVKSENSIKSIQLYDVQGRLLQTKLTDETSSSIDISDKSNGIYFLKITSDKGIKVERIVKE
ncbi:DUF7619 domain-containing protein [Flavobacterium koreense]